MYCLLEQFVPLLLLSLKLWHGLTLGVNELRSY